MPTPPRKSAALPAKLAFKSAKADYERLKSIGAPPEKIAVARAKANDMVPS